jgi:hypothetical protein
LKPGSLCAEDELIVLGESQAVLESLVRVCAREISQSASGRSGRQPVMCECEGIVRINRGLKMLQRSEIATCAQLAFTG